MWDQYISLCKESCVSRWWFLKFDHISYCSLLQMRKTLFLSPLMLIFLAACSPQAYQVNPQPDVSTKPNEIPESQQEGYMRIIGDLRWDKLTSQKEWETRFPGCLKVGRNDDDGQNLIPTGGYIENGRHDEYRKSPNPRCAFTVGGVKFYLEYVGMAKDETGKRITRTGKIYYFIPRDDQQRAFEAAMKEKYTETIEQKDGSFGADSYEERTICSKYSCFKNDLNEKAIFQTPYTTSILDNVKVDPSAF